MASLSPKKLSLFLNISFLFLLSLYLKNHLHNHHHTTTTTTTTTPRRSLRHLGAASDDCGRLHHLPDSASKCLYVQTESSCFPKGYINYLHIFYCTFGQYPLVVGLLVLFLWLAILFYLLGNTAARYFCSTLDGLSKVLSLSPAIAGVTLLSLGNGAPDVFASIVSFTSSGNGDVGLNSILGGAFFVSSVVVGLISIFIAPQRVSVDKASFVRDVVFMLVALFALLVIIVMGKITFWLAIAYVAIYLVYVCCVSVMQMLRSRKQSLSVSLPVSVVDDAETYVPLLYEEKSVMVQNQEQEQDLLSRKDESLFVSLPVSVVGHAETYVVSLSCGEKYVTVQNQEPEQDSLGVPVSFVENAEMYMPLICHVDDEKHAIVQDLRSFNLDSCHYYLSKTWQILELPLYLPRRLTIPVVCENQWCKTYAVASAGLSPTLLATLFSTSLASYIASSLLGFVLAGLAYTYTNITRPPKRFLLPWLAGGFVMSVTWTYITAEELVSLLVSFGTILGISPAVLGLTILAWGNSLGDLIANVAMALNGGADGAQVAISGCYAGPMFNTLLGLGVSLVLSTWSEPYVIPRDHSLYETIGFLIAGLLWALVILPRKNMRLDRSLGCGLLVIYLSFLFLRLARALGFLNFEYSL